MPLRNRLGRGPKRDLGVPFVPQEHPTPPQSVRKQSFCYGREVFRKLRMDSVVPSAWDLCRDGLVLSQKQPDPGMRSGEEEDGAAT